MKKLLVLAVAAAFATISHAAEPTDNEATEKDAGAQSAVWPAYFAICEWPDSPDIVGLRVTIPFSTRQESVTGIDLGFWGRCRDFEGVQLNVLRNDVKDTLGGFQFGVYNSVNRGDLCCIQAGLFNESNSFRGLQVGLINVTGDGEGVQVGIVNRSETLHGFQVGIVNVIRDAEVPVLPIVNVGF